VIHAEPMTELARTAIRNTTIGETTATETGPRRRDQMFMTWITVSGQVRTNGDGSLPKRRVVSLL
jgi:hypothetical protein